MGKLLCLLQHFLYVAKNEPCLFFTPKSLVLSQICVGYFREIVAENFSAHPQIKENIFHVSTKGDMIMALELLLQHLSEGKKMEVLVFTDLSYMTGIPNYKKLIESLHT